MPKAERGLEERDRLAGLSCGLAVRRKPLGCLQHSVLQGSLKAVAHRPQHSFCVRMPHL